MAREKVKVNREALKKVIAATGMTRRDIAELADVKPYEIDSMLSPSAQMIALESLRKICSVLDISENDYISSDIAPKYRKRATPDEMVDINADALRNTIRSKGMSFREVSVELGFDLTAVNTMLKKGRTSISTIKNIAFLVEAPYESFLKKETPEAMEPQKSVIRGGAAHYEDDEMPIKFTDDEFRHIAELAKRHGFQRTTDLFHKLLDDAWTAYRTEKMKNELFNMSEPELEHKVAKIAMGGGNYTKDDLIRKIIRDYLSRED